MIEKSCNKERYLCISLLAPLKDQGFYLPSIEGRILLKETDETYVYRRAYSRD